nr:mast cell protease-like protein isoform X2 [Plodia interpunctella]
MSRSIISASSASYVRTCSGSLINSQFAITSARCLIPSLQYVRCGNMSVPMNETICKSHILTQIAHPGYTHGQKYFNNDIGLIQVQPLVMKNYGRLKAVDYKTLLGRVVEYAGYGGINGLRTFDVEKMKKLKTGPLQIGEGVIYDTQKKDKSFDGDPLLLVAQSCVQRRAAPFIGDPGGPLFVGSQIAGVACLAESVDNRRHPVLNGFVPVSPYLPWIQNVIKIYGSKVVEVW